MRKEWHPGRPVFAHPDFDVENRVVQVQLEKPAWSSRASTSLNGGKDFEAKLKFLQSMQGYVDRARDASTPLILCGDMNVARTDKDVYPRDRKPGVIGQRPDERAIFEGILGTGLTDVGRALDPDSETLFTWWPPWRNMRQKNQGWRIDYVPSPRATGASRARRTARCWPTSARLRRRSPRRSSPTISFLLSLLQEAYAAASLPAARPAIAT